MSVYIKILPGVKVRVSKRGLRWSAGPRAARLYVGAGGPWGVQRLGPVSVYCGLGRRRRR